LQRNKLIYEYQSGFLPKYSTVHQLLEMYNCILNSLEKKEISCFVFCDFSKAFDKVWHKGLLHKIKSYDVDSNLLSWFSSYLQDRQHRVVINNSSSWCPTHILLCFFCFVCLRLVSYVPNVASFSGLSILDSWLPLRFSLAFIYTYLFPNYNKSFWLHLFH
jgi:hypothetical protein